ncbi:MAG: hypothetical protein LBP20_02360 [Treponema sp.]|jgi:hypothetical protein|nr:hypothetical protein [Treponema sp.]
MEEAIKAAIESIITKKIPKGAMFDTHAVIECLIQEHSDTYLEFYRINGGGGTSIHHQNIAFILSKFKDGLIERVGDANSQIWSMNIHGNYNKDACWKKK